MREIILADIELPNSLKALTDLVSEIDREHESSILVIPIMSMLIRLKLKLSEINVGEPILSRLSQSIYNIMEMITNEPKKEG